MCWHAAKWARGLERSFYPSKAQLHPKNPSAYLNTLVHHNNCCISPLIYTAIRLIFLNPSTLVLLVQSGDLRPSVVLLGSTAPRSPVHHICLHRFVWEGQCFRVCCSCMVGKRLPKGSLQKCYRHQLYMSCSGPSEGTSVHALDMQQLIGLYFSTNIIKKTGPPKARVPRWVIHSQPERY